MCDGEGSTSRSNDNDYRRRPGWLSLVWWQFMRRTTAATCDDYIKASELKRLLRKSCSQLVIHQFLFQFAFFPPLRSELGAARRSGILTMKLCSRTTLKNGIAASCLNAGMHPEGSPQVYFEAQMRCASRNIQEKEDLKLFVDLPLMAEIQIMKWKRKNVVSPSSALGLIGYNW